MLHEKVTQSLRNWLPEMCLILSTMNGKTDVYHKLFYPRWYYYGLSSHIFVFSSTHKHMKSTDRELITRMLAISCTMFLLEPTDYMPSENITKVLLHQTSKMPRKDHHEVHGGYLYKNQRLYISIVMQLLSLQKRRLHVSINIMQ